MLNKKFKIKTSYSETIRNLLDQYSSKNSTIVDLGVGTGIMAYDLYKRGYMDVKLVDVENKITLESPYPFYRADLNFDALPFEDASIDAIVANSVIEHLDNPYFILQEAGRVIKSGGFAIVTIPNIFSLRSRFLFLFKGDMRGYSVTNNHKSLFTKATLTKAISGIFRLEEVRYSTGFIRLPFGRKFRFSGDKTKGMWSDDAIYFLRRI